MHPQGHFDLTLHNESMRYGDKDYEEAIKRGELDHLLLDVGVQEKHKSENLLFDTWLTFLFYRSGWSGTPAPPFPYGDWSGAGAGMWALYFTYYDNGSEPNYTDDGDPGYWQVRDDQSYNCGSGCGRHFDQGVSAPEVWSDTASREQIFIRFRFFFYPYEITSNNNNIRGVWITWNEDVNGPSGRDKRWMGRVRFKDANGDFVRIHKTNYQALSLEYTFSFLTV